MVGQPGAQQPQNYPRSPHTRPLPPSAEPGLWAGDEPRASRSSKPRPPELFGVALPGVPLSDTELEVGPARACAEEWRLALPGTGLDARVQALRPPARRCMVARMFLFCTRVVARLDDITSKDGVVVLQARRLRENFQRGAERFARESCDGTQWTAEYRQLLDALAAALIDHMHESE